MPADLPGLTAEDYKLLRDDIARRGIILPIVQDTEGRVLDGKARHKIAEELGLTNVPTITIGKLTDRDRQELRLGLNVLRRHLTQAQRRELVTAYLRLNPAESDRKIGKRVGVSPNTVGNARKRLGAQIEHPDRRTATNGQSHPASKAKPACFTHNRTATREARKHLSDLDDLQPGYQPLRKLRRCLWQQILKERADTPLAQLPSDIDFRQCDWRHLERKLAADLTGAVDLVLTDPPWQDIFAPQRQGWGEWVKRVLKPGGVLLCYTGQYALPTILEELRPHLRYQWQFAALNMIVVSKPGTPTIRGTISHESRFRSCYRSILMFSKGPYKPLRLLQDVLITQELKNYLHPKDWAQPIGESIYFLDKVTSPGSLILDPFAGSATTALATLKLGGSRRWIGCEIDPHTYKVGRRRIKDHQTETVTV